ncbi:MAG: DNA/RNA nuclease SfsA [Alphaproteobacteria bacterium]|nr:DNA/RNA nuclease SfsA [Alphaproteobacteria bacterium]
MLFPGPLVRGRLVRRYKRFLADVVLESGPWRGQAVTAHCPNPGAMLGLTEANVPVWLSRSEDPKRVLPWTWELVQPAAEPADTACLVGINAARPNRIAEEAIGGSLVRELAGYDVIRREVRYGERSRVDLVLEKGDQRCFVEIKNVHLMRQRGRAEFPDSVTARGTRHLRELAALAAQGVRTVVLFVAQRSDAREFAIAGDIDPAFQAAVHRAREAGVEMLCYACALSPEEIVLDRSLPVAV